MNSLIQPMYSTVCKMPCHGNVTFINIIIITYGFCSDDGWILSSYGSVRFTPSQPTSIRTHTKMTVMAEYVFAVRQRTCSLNPT